MRPAIFIKYVVLILSAASFAIASSDQNHKKKILFFAPTSNNNTYWPQVFNVLNAVASDLNIEIKTYEFDVADRFSKHIDGVEILRQKPKPDGAVFSVAFGNSKPLLEVSEALNIPSFIQGPLFPSELPDIGNSPRRKFKNWIGYFYQDEEKKGYLLGKALLEAAHKADAFASNGKIHVAGVGGDFTWFGSKLRKEGLERAVDEDPVAELYQVVPTKWTPEEGEKKTALLLERYPEISVLWAASDQLGIGASSAFSASGRILGKNCFTGGLDLSENGLIHLKRGEIVATVASAMISYAEIIIYLHDYLYGIDFADEVGTKISTDIYTATRENADLHLALLNFVEVIDFKKCSKVYNKALKNYNFSLENFYKEIRESGKYSQ